MSYIEPPLDVDPDSLANDALDYLIANVPGWSPQDGHIEVWLITALARMVAEARTVASAVPTTIFRFFGRSLLLLDPIDAAAASAPSTWTMIDNQGYTIPAGTLVGLRRTGDELVPFRVRDAVTVPYGLTTTLPGEVILDAFDEGLAANGLPAGAAEMIDALSFVESVVTTAITSGGADAETDDEYLDRLSNELQLLTPRPILTGDFAVLARRVPGVHRAVAIDGYDPNKTDHVRFTGGAGAYVSTPDDAALDVPGDIEIVTRVRLADWTPAADVTPAQKAGAYGLTLRTTGALRLWVYVGGVLTNMPDSTVTVDSVAAANEWVWLRATRASGSGNTNYYYSLDQVEDAALVNWTALGVQVVGGAGAVTNSANILQLDGSGAAIPFDMQTALIRNGIGGTLAANFRALDVDPNAPTGYVDSAGRVWTFAAGPLPVHPTDEERTVAVAIVDEAGDPLPTGTKVEVDNYLESLREVNFVVNIIDPTYTAVDVDFTVTVAPEWDTADVIARATAAVEGYLDPASWGGGNETPPVWRFRTVVRLYEVAGVLNNVAGVDEVVTLLLNGAAVDVNLPGVAPLPTAGAVTGAAA